MLTYIYYFEAAIILTIAIIAILSILINQKGKF
jgi:hypothetical protein